MSVLLLIFATVAALAVGGGNPGVAVAPAVAALAVLLVARVPARTLAFALVLVVLCVESPQDRPADGLWQSPLYPLGKLLFATIGSSTGLPLPVSPFELFVVLVALALAFRRQDGAASGAAAYAVRGSALLSAGAVIAWVGLGVATGGRLDAAIWQVRQLALLGPLAFIFHETLTGGRRELIALGRLLVGAASFKALLGIYFYFAVGRPSGLEFEYVTIHADSVLFVGALILLFVWCAHRPSWQRLVTSAAFGAVILWGTYLNDRRVAWVELLCGLVFAVWLMPRGQAQRRAVLAGLAAVPLLVGYAAVGWSSEARIFAPLSALRSVNAQEDSSTFAREVENYNVARTVETSPLWGIGFGHPYREVVVNRIGHSFDLYKYIPHNSFYGLYMATGALGFLLIWFPIPLAVLLAARAARWSAEPEVQTAGVLAPALVLVFGFQAWGDMGTQSNLPILLMALAVGVSARAALRCGAWPARHQAAAAAVGEGRVVSPVGVGT